MQDNSKGRRAYFDIAKGIGIILVVLGHISYISLPLRYFIISFHMPLFFVVSGMLMCITKEENKNPGEYIRAKLKRIGLPYLGYSLMYLLIETAYMYITGTVNYWTIVQNAWLTVCLYGNSVLWFLPSMFFGGLIFYFIRRHCSHIMTVIIVLILTAASYFINSYLQVLAADPMRMFDFIFTELNFFYVMLLRNFFAAFYLCVGYYAYHLYKGIEAEAIKKISSWIYTAAAFLLIVPVYFLAQMNGAVDIHFLVLGNPVVYMAASILGSFAVILLAKGLERKCSLTPVKVLSYYGKNSLTVMATHIDFYVMYVANLIALYILKFIPLSGDGVICCMMLPMVLVGEVIIIHIIGFVKK